jgi:hypothetical protein
MGTQPMTQAYFSVLRWQSDPTRGESRNVAVILVDEMGTVGALRAAPLSTISPSLHQQGLIDAVLQALERRMSSPTHRLRLADLHALRRQLQQSLQITEPRSVAVSDVDSTVRALYRAYAAPRLRGSSLMTKGRLLDRLIPRLRRRGWDVLRGQRVADVLFDLVVDAPAPYVGGVLSFATGAQDYAPAERDAGHLIFGAERVRRPGLAIVQPPSPEAPATVQEAHLRVVRWFSDASVEVHTPDDLLTVPEQETLELAAAR